MSNSKHAPATMVIHGAEVYDRGEFRVMDVMIRDGRIESVGSRIESDGTVPVIDARGCHLLPGLVDLHVHFREPGYSYKETIAGGSEAAARGGFTTVCTMPNLDPVPDCMAGLDAQLEIIGRDSVIETLPFGSITRGRKGSVLVDYGALSPHVAGFSDDGTGVQDSGVMARAMAAIAPTGALLAAHCEVESLLDGGYIHDGEWCRAHGHRGICSRSEWEEVVRDIELAAETGCRLHICHVSTAESVEAVRRAKERGLPVSCETGPHYLAFCDMDIEDDGRFKMNPPIRSGRDRDALRRGVADGTVDVIATDHAPHSAEEKSRGLAGSAMGVVGLETSLAATYTTMVATGLMGLGRMVEAMADTPRRLLGRDPHVIAPGHVADLTLVDFSRRWTVDPSRFAGHGHATPFAGMELQGRVLMTVAGGRTVYRRGEDEE